MADSQLISIFDASTGEVRKVERIYKNDEEWKKTLTPEQFRVTRQECKEEISGEVCTLHPERHQGVFQCVGCGTDLFLLANPPAPGKPESVSWLNDFLEPVSELNIFLNVDNRFGTTRMEVRCARCDAFLGHVFNDGPTPANKRFCINSSALCFVDVVNPKRGMVEKATFGAGCFWVVQSAFDKLKGVVRTTAGYTGGTVINPTFEQVNSDRTGHAQAIQVEYIESAIPYSELLDIFWDVHDPTIIARQGVDFGHHYRSAIFYHTPEQEKAARISMRKMEECGKFKGQIVTEIVPAGIFYRAEEEHQHYSEKHGEQKACSAFSEPTSTRARAQM